MFQPSSSLVVCWHLSTRNPSIPSCPQGQAACQSVPGLFFLFAQLLTSGRTNMELTGFSMCDTQLDFDDDVDFSFNTFAGCPCQSTCCSSYASSSFGPQTPISGRSSPRPSSSVDFGSSFASSIDTPAFELTPPSSATSSYFSMGSKAECVYAGFPVTPSRGQLSFTGHPISPFNEHLVASHPMDCAFPMDDLGSQPHFSTPSTLGPDGQVSDICSLWGHSESPISFGEPLSPRLGGTVQSVKREAGEDRITPSIVSAEARRRAKIEEVRHKTAALHQAQQQSPSNGRTRTKPGKQLPLFVTESGGHFEGEAREVQVSHEGLHIWAVAKE